MLDRLVPTNLNPFSPTDGDLVLPLVIREDQLKPRAAHATYFLALRKVVSLDLLSPFAAISYWHVVCFTAACSRRSRT